MTESAIVALTYEGQPIASGGAHKLRMPRRAAYAKTMSFLASCGATDERIAYSFRVHEVPGSSEVRDHEEALERRFGRGQLVILDEAEVDDALDFLDEVDPQPTNAWGMCSIWFDLVASFRLVEPLTGEPLAGQSEGLFDRLGYRNKLRLTLNNQAQIELELCIPSPNDELLMQLLPHLQSGFPCKFSLHHWRAWHVTKAATLRQRKADVSRFLQGPPLVGASPAPGRG